MAAKKSSDKKPKAINVGIVGTGIGGTHFNGYSKVPGVNVVGIVDIDPARAKAVAAKWEVPHAFTNHEDLLELKNLDAVSVCTPNSLHVPISIDALRAGKHVICEKPMSSTVEDAQRLADEAEKATKKGQIFMMGLNNRYRGEAQLLKQYIDAGDLGELYLGKCGWLRRSGIPGLGGWFTTKKMSGGGPLIDLGVHALDLCWWLMGAPDPVSVSASVFTKIGRKEWERRGSPGTYDIEDAAVAHIRFANDAAIMVEVSWILNAPTTGFTCEVMGTEGGGRIEPNFQIVKDLHGSPTDLIPSAPRINGHEQEIVHFISCIRESRAPISGARDGLAVQKMLDAIYRSGESGKPISIS